PQGARLNIGRTHPQGARPNIFCLWIYRRGVAMRSIKFFIGYAVAILLIVVVITINAVCSIAQFEVTVTGSSFGEERAADIQAALDEEFGGKSYLFFRENSVYDVVAKKGDGYLEVESVEKHFPNKITVSLSEKYEVFAFLNETDG